MEVVRSSQPEQEEIKKKKKIQTFSYFSEALGYINDFSAPPPYIFSYCMKQKNKYLASHPIKMTQNYY